MSFRNKFFAINFFIFFISTTSSANITSGWEKPFSDAIKKLKNNDWQSRMISKKEFIKKSASTRQLLKKNKPQWEGFIEQKNNIDSGLVDDNAVVAKIFPTKKNTLIFKSFYQPHTIIKIDQRDTNELDQKLRSYFSAYEKTQSVQKIHKFSHLYLPIEYGIKSKKTSLKYVFSEEVPLFSEAEIDNIALLIYLHNAIDKGDKALLKEIKISFSEMLNYICQVDFDDINYRNVPFAKDGRLAPIDTDSHQASTGIFSFVENFFAFKFFPTLSSIEAAIPNDCFNKLKFNSYGNLYADEKRLEIAYQEFNEARDYFDKIIAFLKTRKARIIPKIVINEEEIQPFVDLVNEIIAKKIFYSSEKKLTFGWRCEHARDFVTEAAEKIIKKDVTISPEEADDKVRKILTAAKNNNVMFSYDNLSIQAIENVDGIRGFICF